MATTNVELEQLAKFLGIHINSVLLQDDLEETKAVNGSYIINYGDEKNGGTHWVLLIVENSSAFFFDSFGAHYSQDIERFIGHIPHKAYNQYIVQDLDSSLCGWYCLAMIKYNKLFKTTKNTLFNRCNDFINLFQDDTEKNGPLLRQMFMNWLKDTNIPKGYYKILQQK